MPDFVFGTPIFYEQYKSNLELTHDDPESLDEDDVCKLMAQQAMRAKDETVNDAIKQLNGMKEDWGTGVSTRVMVYNGLGVPLKFRSKHDDYGYWSVNTLADRIEVGQWSIGFHHKTHGAASGSCAVVGYDLLGYGHDDILMVGFSTPWGSKSSSALCKVMTAKKWAPTPWSDVMNWIYDSDLRGTENFGRASVRYQTQNDSSPTLEVVVTRSDIGL